MASNQFFFSFELPVTKEPVLVLKDWDLSDKDSPVPTIRVCMDGGEAGRGVCSTAVVFEDVANRDNAFDNLQKFPEPVVALAGRLSASLREMSASAKNGEAPKVPNIAIQH
jgi:hypothetical protein